MKIRLISEVGVLFGPDEAQTHALVEKFLVGRGESLVSFDRLGYTDPPATDGATIRYAVRSSGPAGWGQWHRLWVVTWALSAQTHDRRTFNLTIDEVAP